MLNVSQTYKELIKSYAREFSFVISRNGTVLTDAHILDIDIEEAGFSAGELNIGEFCRNSISITAGIAENVTWQKGDTVSVQMQIVGATDVIPMGVFTVNEVKRVNDYTILITGYDVPAWYSETFDQTSTNVQTNIAYTETTGGMSLTNKNLLTTTTVEIPEGITLSNMDYLRYVAGLDGYNIRSNRQGNLELYKVTPVVTNDPDDPIYIDYIDRENILEDGLSVNDTMTSIDSFTIISAEGYEYHTGTGYGITNENPFVTEDSDKTKMTGYLGLEYYAAEVTFRGDPSLQIGDIVGVPYNDEIVPTIIMSQRFKIDGGISCVIGSQTSQEEKEIVPVSPTEKKIISVKTVADAAQAIAKAINQHFWYDTNGAHVSTEAGNPTGSQNTVWNTLGMLFRAGVNNILAIVTGNDPGMDVYDGEGNNAENVIASYRGSGIRIGKDPTSETSAAYFDTSGMKVKSRYNYSPMAIYDIAGIGSTTGEVTKKNVKSLDSSWTYECDFTPWEGTDIIFYWRGSSQYSFTAGTADTITVSQGTFSYDGIKTITFTPAAGSGSEAYVTFVYQAYGTAGNPILFVGDIDSSIVRAGYTGTIGTSLIASTENQLIIGRLNDNQANHAFEIGNGTDANTRSNAFTVDWSGNVEAAGTIKAKVQESTITVNTSNVTAGNTNACWHNGVVASLSYNFTCKSSLANNGTLAVGTLPSGYEPMYAVVGSAYTSNASVVEVTINTSGVITIRNVTGSAIATSVTIRVGATYAI